MKIKLNGRSENDCPVICSITLRLGLALADSTCNSFNDPMATNLLMNSVQVFSCYTFVAFASL